nr:transglutaminase domain-containing protein [Pseudodesulfovibrio sp.]
MRKVLIALCILIPLNIASLYFLREFNLLQTHLTAHNASKIIQTVKKSPSSFKYNQALKIMQQVGNTITLTEPASGNGKEILKSGKALCLGMTKAFRALLKDNHIESRRVILKRYMVSRYDIHVASEVKINNKWILFDPTFNLTFHDKDGRNLSAEEIQQNLTYTNKPINLQFHGKRAYPANINSYYINLKSLFNIVLVYKNTDHQLRKYPISRWWYGPQAHIFDHNKDMAVLITMTNTLYMMAILIMPCLILTICLFFICRMIFRSQKD